jgi:hypothetical protein
LKSCRRVSAGEWGRSRTLWQRLEGRIAYWLLVRLDPKLARRHWRALPD